MCIAQRPAHSRHSGQIVPCVDAVALTVCHNLVLSADTVQGPQTKQNQPKQLAWPLLHRCQQMLQPWVLVRVLCISHVVVKAKTGFSDQLQLMISSSAAERTMLTPASRLLPSSWVKCILKIWNWKNFSAESSLGHYFGWYLSNAEYCDHWTFPAWRPSEDLVSPSW